MSKAYYILAVRRDGYWEMDFGDYDREAVEAERDHLTDNFVYKGDTRIIKTGDSNEAIKAAVSRLNVLR